jgi:hypothetical protein
MFRVKMRFLTRAGVTQLVECDLAKVDVAGSNPVSRSKILPLMIKSAAVLFCVAAFASAQEYKLETIATPAPGVPAAYAAELAGQGHRVVGPSGTWCEVWFVKAIPTGAKPTDPAIVFPIAQGTLLGVIRFPGAAYDRRGQQLKAGTYTLRYSDFPPDGAHQGVAPQRDFALATPVGSDADPKAAPDFDKLVAQSKLGGTAHAAVFSIEPPVGSAMPSVAKEGEHDWVLSVKVGELGLGIIVVGKVE